jgi:hypothetical protein
MVWVTATSRDICCANTLPVSEWRDTCSDRVTNVVAIAPLVLCSSRLLCDDGATARHVIYDGQWRGSDRSPLGRCGPSLSMVAPVFSIDLNGYMGFGPA